MIGTDPHPDLSADLRSFLDPLVFGERFDYIVPVERSGTAVLRVLYKDQPSVLHRVISPRAAGVVFGKRRSLVRLLLFDDSFYHGKFMNALANRLRGRYPVTVENAAFLVNQEASYPKPQHRFHLVDTIGYGRLKDELGRWLLSHGEPLDVEHLAFEIHPLDAELRAWLVKILAHLAPLLRVPSPSEREGVDVLTSDFLAVRKTLYAGQMTDALSEGVAKVRWFIHSSGRAVAIPIVYPAVRVHLTGAAPSLRIPDLGEYDNWRVEEPAEAPTRGLFERLTVDLGVRLFTRVIGWLFARLSRERLPWPNVRLVESSLTYSFPTAADSLRRFVEGELEDVRGRVRSGRVEEFPVAEQLGLSLSPDLESGRERGQHRARLRLPIQIAVFVYEEWQKLRLERGVSETQVDEIGVPFSRILQVFANVATKTEISQWLDALLDQSVLTPTVDRQTLRDRDVDAEYWVRVYRPGGEHVKRQLEGLLAFVRRDLEAAVSVS